MKKPFYNMKKADVNYLIKHMDLDAKDVIVPPIVEDDNYTKKEYKEMLEERISEMNS